MSQLKETKIPRGVEVLVKKASVDPVFREMLLEKRAAAAHEIGLELEPSEAAMLEAVPQSQLEAIISSTKVSPKVRPAFLGWTAAVMIAALGTCAVGVSMVTLGISPDDPRMNPVEFPHDPTAPGSVEADGGQTTDGEADTSATTEPDAADEASSHDEQE